MSVRLIIIAVVFGWLVVSQPIFNPTYRIGLFFEGLVGAAFVAAIALFIYGLFFEGRISGTKKAKIEWARPRFPPIVERIIVGIVVATGSRLILHLIGIETQLTLVAIPLVGGFVVALIYDPV
jgi:hypothetical protein